MKNVRPIGTSQRIADIVYASLRDAIFSHELAAGESLSVPELARRFGVSRSPIREAVLHLVADGLAVDEPRKGAVVTELCEEDLLFLHELREPLEGMSARLAAQQISDAQASELREMIRREDAVIHKNGAGNYTHSDINFHAFLEKVHRKAALSHLLRILTDQMRLSVSVALIDPEHQRLGHEEHKAVAEAILMRSPEAAEERMRDHIRRARARVASSLRKLAAETAKATKNTSNDEDASSHIRKMHMSPSRIRIRKGGSKLGV